MSRLVVDLTPAEHRTLKARAVMNGRTLSSYAKSYLFHIPNAETLEAMNDIENKNNLVEFDSVDSLFSV